MYSDEQIFMVENRIKNLMWTVSGDYKLDTKLDVASFSRSKYIAMYDAVKQGAFARYFDHGQLGLYLVKKIYYGAEEKPLTELAQLCVDAAVYQKLAAERPGIPEVREKAFEALLEHSFVQMTYSLPGRVKIAMIRIYLDGAYTCEQKIEDALKEILELEQSNDVMDLIRVTDNLYNRLIDQGFVKKHGDLSRVLEVTQEDLKEFDWGDYLEEEITEDLLEQYLNKMNAQVTSMQEDEDEKEQQTKKMQRKVLMIDEAAAAKMYSYMELNYGKSYLTKREQEYLNQKLCRGAHADCSLYLTDGILQNPVLSNAQYVNAKRHAEKNKLLFRNSRNIMARNIEQLSAELHRSLMRRSEPEQTCAWSGDIVPKLLWKINRVKDPGKLFLKTTKRPMSEFVVDILMDASGSQRKQQSQVALQAYMISEALSNNQIPHRIMSFCSFWDYTILQRFREYDAPREENLRILDYVTSSNNRDGLAIRAAGDSLLMRPEEGKILIVLSDGKPNDIIINRPNCKNPKPYYGEYAVKDTAFEVRKLRSNGVFVLGVFTGKEKDLLAEKKIFGKDFAYIRNIESFSKIVSRYLRKLLESE